MADGSSQPVPDVSRRTVQLHGHRLSYLEAGPTDGPLLVLVHGLASDATVWLESMGPLAARGLHVLAPDLLGHGRSDKPPTDYSVGGFTNSVRDLLVVLGHRSATMVGHSLGGGVAVQFLYQYPAQCDRVVLVAAGGMGRDVHPALRAAALPGVNLLLRLLINPVTARLIVRFPWLPRLLGIPSSIAANLGRGLGGMATRSGHLAFFATLNFIIGPAGQRVSALDKIYLADDVPILIMTAEGDSTIPPAHARHLHERLPHSRLVVLPGRTHEPHRRHAGLFADAVADFVATTEPSTLDAEQWATRLASGGEARPYWT